jgi:hypothetical protein
MAYTHCTYSKNASIQAEKEYEAISKLYPDGKIMGPTGEEGSQDLNFMVELWTESITDSRIQCVNS